MDLAGARRRGAWPAPAAASLAGARPERPAGRRGRRHVVVADTETLLLVVVPAALYASTVYL